MAERNSGHARDPLDFYVEEEFCIHHLLNIVPIVGAIHDPCCGLGTIPFTVGKRGYKATGADIMPRYPGFGVWDFFDDTNRYENILINPPFRRAAEMVEHALRLVQPGGVVAVIGQSKFLWSQGRVDLYDRCERVIILAKRPNMPTGTSLIEHGEAIRGGGSIDYEWCVWRGGVVGPTDCRIEWVI